MNAADLTLDRLWKAEGAPERESGGTSDLPEPARRYLEHAVAPGTPSATAVRLRMHGEIKLGGWLPFRAEEVIHRTRGMIWKASTRMKGLPVRGSDRILDGEGALRWKLLGVIPVMTAAGPDVSRSTAGRLATESVWLPSVFRDPGVAWSASDGVHPKARLTVQGRETVVTLTVDGEGRLEAVASRRWGNPEGAEFREVDFGGYVEEEAAFGGFTIPTRLRIGWHFGSARFESEGEFFRVTVDEARFR